MARCEWFKRLETALRVLALPGVFAFLLSPAYALADVGRWTSNGPMAVVSIQVAIDPTASQTLYVSTKAGIFKTTDGGTSWHSASSGVGARMGLLRVDPQRSGTLYAAIFGAGVLKSTDGGASWFPASVGLPADLEANDFAIDPRNSAVLYIASYEGLFKSTDGANTWRTIAPDVGEDGPLAVAVDPRSSETVYVGTYDGVLKSTDGGETFQPVNRSPADTPVYALTVDPRNSSTIYAAAANGVLKSNDAGVNWIVRNTGLPVGGVIQIVVDPSDSNKAYAATVIGLFRSLDGGGRWQELHATFFRQKVPVPGIALDPFDPRRLYAATYFGGIGTSRDGGATWTSVNGGLTESRVPTLSVATARDAAGATAYAGSFLGQLFRTRNGGVSWSQTVSPPSFGNIDVIAVDQRSPDTIYVGGGNLLARSRDAGETWTFLSTFPVVRLRDLEIDSSNSEILYAGTAIGVYKSSDSGNTWTLSSSGLTERYVVELVLDPVQSSTVYAATGGGGVFKSVDAGASWAPANTGITASFGTNISVQALALDPSDPLILYAAMVDQRMYRSSDGGVTWSLLPVRNLDIYQLLVTRDGTVYAIESDELIRSTTRGSTWEPFRSGLPSGPVYALAGDTSGRHLYAATSDGVFDYTVAGSCLPSGGRLCLLGGRFEVTVRATDPRTGRVSAGSAIPQTDRFGYFSLPDFTGDSAFPEVFVKMADATSIGGGFWAFHSGLTDVQYEMTVLDTRTGMARVYRNDRSDPARLCGGADTAAFPAALVGGGFHTGEKSGLASFAACTPNAETICLLAGRFAVSLSAADPRTGASGQGRAIPRGDRFGYFSLPSFTGDATFPEVFVKMLDARALGGFFWTFHTGLTDLQYTMTVTDTLSGATRVYRNDRSDPVRLCGGADTAAFQ